MSRKPFRCAPRRTPVRRTWRPSFELLEPRLAPALVHWTLNGDGDWNVATNWENNHVPALGDTAVLDVPNVTITVRDSESVDTLQSVDTATLAVSSDGRLTLGAVSTIDTAIQLAGELSARASGPVTLAGNVQWAGGVLSSNGFGFVNTGTLTVAGANDAALTGLLTNDGSLVVVGTANLAIGNYLVNDTPGRIDLQSDAGITGNGQIDNRGTIQKSAGTGVSRIGPSLNSNLNFNQLGGTLDAQTGTLRLDQTRTNTFGSGAVWNAQAGAVLDFVGNGPSGTYLAGTFTGSGLGTVQISSGNFYIPAGGATFDFPAGLLQWTGGYIGSQPLTNSGVITLSGAADKALAMALNNNGSIIVTDTGNLVVLGTLNNNATGLIDLQSDAGITGNSTINNSGTIRKSAGTGVSRIGPSANFSLNFNQLGGTLDAQTGTLRLDQTTTNTFGSGAVWNAQAGAVLDFVGNGPSGTYLAGTFTGSGLGTVQISSGNFYIPAGGATFDFPAGLLQWTGGYIGSQPLTNSGVITLSGAADKALAMALNNNGSIIVTDTGNLVVLGTLNNNATGLIDLQSDAGITGNSTINNSGTIRKSAGTGVSRIGPSANFSLNFNQLGGTLDAQTGTLRLDQTTTNTFGSGAVWNAQAGAVLDFVGNGPSGTYLAGTFTGSGLGTVQISSGNFYIPAGGATFDFPASLLQWTGGFIGSNPLTNTGVITLSGVADKAFGMTLNNNGTIIVTDTGNLAVLGTLNNNATGLIDLQSDAGITGNSTINNSGTIRKSAGTGVSRIGPSANFGLNFNQLGGTLDAQSGTLRLDQTRTNTFGSGAVWNAESNAILDFVGNGPSGTFFGGTFTGSGAGTVQLSSGFFYIASGGATFDFPAGFLQWTGGVIGSNPLTNNGVITLAGSADKELDATLNNNGIINEPGTGNFVVTNTLNNTSTGLLDIQSDAGITGGGVLNNFGTVRKSAGTGTSAIVATFNSTPAAAIDVQSGRLQLRNGGTWTGGAFQIDAGAVLEFANSFAFFNLSGSYTGSGAGFIDHCCKHLGRL